MNKYVHFTSDAFSVSEVSLEEALDAPPAILLPDGYNALGDQVIPITPFQDTWGWGDYERQFEVHTGTISTPF